jgi:hypothetical protein
MSDIWGSLNGGTLLERGEAGSQSTSNCIKKERVTRPQRIKELRVISKR